MKGLVVALLCGLLSNAAIGEVTRYQFAALPPVQHTSLKCGTNSFPPFGYEHEGRAAGVEVDLVKEMGRRLGIAVEVDIYPWPRMLKMMQNGQLDCMFAAFYTPEREQYMSYTRMPIHVSRLALYTRKDRVFEFRALEDLKGKRIGILRDFKTVAVLDQRLDEGFADVIYGKDFNQLFDLLEADRVEVVIVNHHVGDHLIITKKLSSVVELPMALSSNSAFITFTRQRDYQSLIPKFEYALFEMMAEGDYRDTFERHIERYYQSGQ